MTKKRIFGRIINKHGTEAYWISNHDFIPLQGEFIVYDKDETHNYERFKIGDGVTVIGSLPFLSNDGYTPIRGTDYWTDADKAEIKAYVDEAILGGEW